METKVPSNLSEWTEAKIREESGGGILFVTFPTWARPVFQETVAAASRLGISGAQVAVLALSSWLEGHGYLKYTPPKETKPALPAGVEDQIRQVIHQAVTGADATTKKEKDDALNAILPLLRDVLYDSQWSPVKEES